ncbi:MAG: hypothetical protein ACI4RU_08720, partial [Acutalibacteraceae bacterium]
KLLRECDAGVKMAVSSFDDVIDKTQSPKLREMLEKSKEQHSALGGKISQALLEAGDDGKSPNPMAKGMSWIKTNMKMAVDNSDKTIADLMTDGCDMGIKSLSRYLNQYSAADKNSKDIAKELIKIELDLLTGLREFL